MIAEMVLMSATESVVSCSPKRTRILDGDWPNVQWAAVRMCRFEIMDPPQNGRLPLEGTRPTCHGNSLTSVSTPPTILWAWWDFPQVHFGFGPKTIFAFLPST